MAGQNNHKRQKPSDESSEKETKRKKIVKNEETATIDEDSEKNVNETEIEQTAGSLSLNVEETNKLRAQLGLAPLETDEDVNLKTDEFVHVPARNISDEVLAEKYREKIQLLKEKRELNQKISKIKKIYDVDESDNIDDVTAWVTKTRSLPTPIHHKAEQKIVTKEQPSLFVEHDQGEFEAGEEAILTLKDADVLGEDEDKLINTNLVDLRKARENIKNRSKASDYNPYDEFDEQTGQLKPAQLLSKYDEEIYGKSIPHFKIQPHRNVVPQHTEMTEFLQSVRHQQKESLHTNMRIGKDYFTADEYNLTFKKPKKKRKEKLKSIATSVTQNQKVFVDSTQKSAIADAKNHPEDSVYSESIYEDESSVELQKALERTRNSKLQNIKRGVEFVDSVISKHEGGDFSLKSGIIIDLVSEFVRSHDSYPKYKDPQSNISTEITENPVSDQPESVKVKANDSTSTVFGDEPTISRGVGAALQLLSKKGYLDDQKPKTAEFETNIPKTLAIVDREKTRSINKGYRRNNRNSGDEDYKFEIDVGYYDKHGVMLEPKDAFREVSYKFHGKRPAKKKMVKRALKKEELKSDSDISKSLKIMSDKQKCNKTPYLVLTGSNTNILSSSNIKKPND